MNKNKNVPQSWKILSLRKKKRVRSLRRLIQIIQKKKLEAN
jgi:hypothetical protein